MTSTELVCPKCGKPYKTERWYNLHVEKCDYGEEGTEVGGEEEVPKIKKSDPTPSKAYKLFGWLMYKYKFYSMKRDGTTPIWIYDEEKGIWASDGKTTIRKDVQFLLQGMFTKHVCNETETQIQYSSTRDDTNLGGPADRITVQNGVYNLADFTFSEGFCPDELHITAIPVQFDAHTQCPEIRKFLGEILPKQEDQIAVIEFLGYCLWKRYDYALLLMLAGEGENGKTVLMNLMKEFLGRKNVSSVSLHQIATNRFMPANLHGKLANICGDIPAKPLKYTGEIKKLTGGDYTTVERKNQDSFQFMSYAKLVFSANQPPKIDDPTIAFFRRMRVIEFTERFRASDPKTLPMHVLMKKLTTPKELSGLFNLAIKGLKRLHRRGTLTGASTPEESRLAYYRISDPIKYMVEAFCYANPLAEPIYKNHFHDLYTQLCAQLKKVSVDSSVFAKELKIAAPYIEDKRPTIEEEDGGKTKKTRVSVWMGLGVDFDALNAEIAGRENVIPVNPVRDKTYREVIQKNKGKEREGRGEGEEKHPRQARQGGQGLCDDIFETIVLGEEEEDGK